MPASVDELLDDLRAAGIQTAVCTDMLADIQMEKLERLGCSKSVVGLVVNVGAVTV